MSDTTWWAQADLPPTRLAPRVARRLLADLLLAWSQPHLDGLADDATVVVSELVTNAVLHAGGDGALRLEISADQNGTLRIAISDGSSLEPTMQELTDDAEGGRGLQIVQRLSARWGVEDGPSGGKRIWVELSHDA
jgi:anti-sigma regulatory factor (Ser/Thr protein kinase)